MPKMVCRRNRLDKKPYCLTHTCYYKSKGMCEGAIHAERGYYSYYNCPDEPDTGGQPGCGTLQVQLLQTVREPQRVLKIKSPSSFV